MVAIVVKYADNILKGFSTSVSIVFCAVYSVSAGVPADPVGGGFALGAAMVVLSSFMYNSGGAKNKEELLPK